MLTGHLLNGLGGRFIVTSIEKCSCSSVSLRATLCLLNHNNYYFNFKIKKL